MARRQTFSGESIEGILVDIRESYGNEAKIISATRMKHRSSFGLGSRYTYEVTIERQDPPPVVIQEQPAVKDRLDVRTSDPRDFATFATELQRAWLDAQRSGQSSDSTADQGGSEYIGFVDADTEDTLVISADARRSLASVGGRKRSGQQVGAASSGMNMSDDSDPFVDDYPQTSPSAGTPMVVSSQGRWRIPAKVTLPTWRSISSKAKPHGIDDRAYEDGLLEDPEDPFVRDWEEIHGRSVQDNFTVQSTASVSPAAPTSSNRAQIEQPDAQGLVEAIPKVIDLRFGDADLAGEMAEMTKTSTVPPRNRKRSAAILDLLRQLHQNPPLSFGGVVIFSSASGDGLVNFEALCDVYGIESDRRFIGSGRGIPTWLSTPPQRVASALKESGATQKSFAIWLADREIGQLIAALGRRSSLVFAHLEDPGRGEIKSILELPRIDGICLSRVLSSDSVERALSLKLPILTLEGGPSSADRWIRLIEAYLEVQD